MCLLYWYIEKTINIALLKNKRADYSESIIATLSQQLSKTYGKEFTVSISIALLISIRNLTMNKKLRHCQQLSWSHFISIGQSTCFQNATLFIRYLFLNAIFLKLSLKCLSIYHHQLLVFL
jgi:hypothetical protein